MWSGRVKKSDSQSLLCKAFKQLKHRRPHIPPDAFPNYSAVKTVLESFKEPKFEGALEALAEIGADLEAIACSIARANWIKEGIQRLTSERDKNLATAHKAKQRAKKSQDLQKMMKGFGTSAHFEARSLTQSLARATRSNRDFSQGKGTPGKATDWAAAHLHSELYIYFQRYHGRPFDQIIFMVMKACGFFHSNQIEPSNQIELLKRQRNILRKKFPSRFPAPSPPNHSRRRRVDRKTSR